MSGKRGRRIRVEFVAETEDDVDRVRAAVALVVDLLRSYWEPLSEPEPGRREKREEL